jgi:transposase
MQMKRPFYTEEFKIQAAKQVVEQGFTCTEVASRLGMSAQSLSNWITKYHGANSRGLKKDQKILSKDEEIRRLKVELKQAKMERDILKKAAAFFANHPE